MVKEKNLYSLDDFTERNGVSRTMLDTLWAQGIGPHKTYIGARVFVAAEDEKAWLELMRNPTGKAAKFAAKNAEMLKEKARRAGMAPHAKRGRQV